MANRYSVYRAKDDMPLVIYATAKECADALGISIQSFYKAAYRFRSGKYENPKWSIYEDEEDYCEDNA